LIVPQERQICQDACQWDIFFFGGAILTHLADARVLHRQVATLVALSSANVGGAAPRQRGDLPAQYSSIHQMSQERLFSIKKEKIRKQILRLSPRNMWRTLGTPDVST